MGQWAGERGWNYAQTPKAAVFLRGKVYNMGDDEDFRAVDLLFVESGLQAGLREICFRQSVLCFWQRNL